MADEIRYRDSCESMAILASTTGQPPLDVWLWHRHEHRSSSTPYCRLSADDVSRGPTSCPASPWPSRCHPSPPAKLQHRIRNWSLRRRRALCGTRRPPRCSSRRCAPPHGPWCDDGACSFALSSWLYTVWLADAPDLRRRLLLASYVGLCRRLARDPRDGGGGGGRGLLWLCPVPRGDRDVEADVQEVW
ncbi:hypothetical protein ISF_02788 [Cordyceps fumosorosea ARSEF 2679]|uniref:Uncharacterized protein n=1 Tax=Cordyceps fumosorosea (strain ARSEF 2679) TaxID=1081104 RepID=A0A168B2A4_CORFA|nr:hypothetical protein ISF_02788 [Cordyceps fumosorosea ARSEF 2679]OAA69518.1 hypothetical protein ISF_02788 [Cordyceps fumosorosea ARSEF 2679]